MVRLIVSIVLFVCVSACTSMHKEGGFGAADSLYGELFRFDIAQGGSVDSKMLVLQAHTGKRLNDVVSDASFRPDMGAQWGVLKFKYWFTPWVIGMQFIVDPSNTRVGIALVRSIGTDSENKPDPEVLSKIRYRLAEGLRLTANMESSEGVN